MNIHHIRLRKLRTKHFFLIIIMNVFKLKQKFE